MKNEETWEWMKYYYNRSHDTRNRSKNRNDDHEANDKNSKWVRKFTEIRQKILLLNT